MYKAAVCGKIIVHTKLIFCRAMAAIASQIGGAETATCKYGRLAGRLSGNPDGRSKLASILKSCKTVLLDCDGVLWRGKTPIEGSAAAIQSLTDIGKDVILLTNNSTKSRSAYVHKVKEVLGIDVPATSIFGSAFAAAKLLRSEGIPSGALVYVVGEEGLHEELRAEGYETLGLEDSLSPFSMDSFSSSSLESLGDIKAVVVGLDTQASYAKIARATALTRRLGVRFFATNGDTTFPAKDTLLPGAGAVLAAVEAGAGRRAEAVAGKPSGALLSLLQEHAGVDPATALMVGDRLNTDILFGN